MEQPTSRTGIFLEILIQIKITNSLPPIALPCFLSHWRYDEGMQDDATKEGEMYK